VSNEQLGKALLVAGEGLGRLGDRHFQREENAEDRSWREKQAAIEHNRTMLRQGNASRLRKDETTHAGKLEGDAKAGQARRDDYVREDEQAHELALGGQRYGEGSGRGSGSNGRLLASDIYDSQLDLRDELNGIDETFKTNATENLWKKGTPEFDSNERERRKARHAATRRHAVAQVSAGYIGLESPADLALYYEQAGIPRRSAQHLANQDWSSFSGEVRQAQGGGKKRRPVPPDTQDPDFVAARERVASGDQQLNYDSDEYAAEKLREKGGGTAAQTVSGDNTFAGRGKRMQNKRARQKQARAGAENITLSPETDADLAKLLNDYMATDSGPRKTAQGRVRPPAPESVRARKAVMDYIREQGKAQGMSGALLDDWTEREFARIVGGDVKPLIRQNSNTRPRGRGAAQR